ncbi:hypothetical protein RND71_011560 [Anisodus tanguticus]|uniref:Uncharacterized protein n=1 Tax=Anisodus tanguticus TaxID=243964 RepID=A0AAE1SBQ3_9SOLA|nr:hypothetical protein RND71_011560 [Anisodus tanguticus]
MQLLLRSGLSDIVVAVLVPLGAQSHRKTSTTSHEPEPSCTANGMAKSILESVGQFCIAFNATLAIFRGRAHEITRCSYSFTGEEKILQRADACLGIRSYTSRLAFMYLKHSSLTPFEEDRERGFRTLCDALLDLRSRVNKIIPLNAPRYASIWHIIVEYVPSTALSKAVYKASEKQMPCALSI